MRKIIKLSVLLVVVIFSSCSSPLKKSVIEPIEINDLKDIIEKDTLFEYTYKAIQKIRDAKLTNDDVEKAKWSDMSYNRIHKIVQLYSDTLAQSKYTDKIKSDWNSKYGELDTKFDSVINYWKKYKIDNSLEPYVKVELFDVKTDERGYASMGFKITPLKGELDRLKFKYEFNKKSDEKKSSYNDDYWIVAINDRISKSIIFWEFDPRNDDKIKNKLLDEVLDEYEIDIEISEIKKNGVKLSIYDFEVPVTIRIYLDKEEDGLMLEYWKENIIKEYLTDNYVRYSSFKSSKMDSIVKTIDPKVIEFLELTDKK